MENILRKKKMLDRLPLGQKFLFFIPLAVVVVLCVMPFLILISTSVSPSDYITDHGVVILPSAGFSIDAYRVVFIYPMQILNAYKTSLIVMAGGVSISMVLTILTAYPLSRSDFTYRKRLIFLFYFTTVFQGGMIANYILFRNYLMIFDTYWVMILPGALNVGHLFLLRNFYASLPDSLIESARLDGASEFTILFRIAVPLTAPGIATVAFYSVLFYWNDANSALLYMERSDIVPVALYITRVSRYIEFVKWAEANTGIMMDFELPEATVVFATTVVTTLPMMFAFMAFQKYFVAGLTSGGVKE